MPRRIAAFVLAGVLTALVSGCNTMPSQVRDQIAKRLPAMLGPADDYHVDVSGDILELLRGKLKYVHIHGDNVMLSPVLHACSFDAEARDIHANTKTDAIESIGSVTFHIEINQTNLDNYLRTSNFDSWAHGARVTLGASNMTYSDSVGLLGLSAPFAVTGELRPHPGRADQMDFIPSSGSVMHLSVPAKLVRFAASRDNPVVDLSQMKYPVQIRSAIVKARRMEIDGSVNLTSLVGPNPATVAPPPSPAAHE